MSNPVCISPLKFYDSLAKQSHRKSYAYNHIVPLITKTGWIPPFQFVISTQLYLNGNSFAKTELFNAKTDEKICDIPLDYAKLKEEVTDNFTVGYRNKSGEWRSNSSYSYVYFDVNEGDIVFADKPIMYICAYSGTSVVEEAGRDNAYLSYYVVPIGITKIAISAKNSVTKFTHLYKDEKNKFGIYTIDDTYKVFIHSGKDKLNLNIPEGLYYLKLASGNEGLWTYYSEVFCFTNVTKDCLELEYWNETGNFAVKNGVIAFPADFHFKLLLKGEIGKPEYNFEEESTKRLGYIFVESQVSKKTYKFNTIVPEYICDALRLVRLCDNKIIRCKDDEYEAITFEMEAEWQTQGDLASVTCEFETDNVIANIGGFVPDKLGGDYNNDYSEDFDKE